ncbi:hypothetical protein B0H13DRAFT_2298157 [Mycena leptocephala]|nr:hypothetical protein B0H13DRAFT_2298157 [Mycena leptocephala]
MHRVLDAVGSLNHTAFALPDHDEARHGGRAEGGVGGRVYGEGLEVRRVAQSALREARDIHEGQSSSLANGYDYPSRVRTFALFLAIITRHSSRCGRGGCPAHRLSPFRSFVAYLTIDQSSDCLFVFDLSAPTRAAYSLLRQRPRTWFCVLALPFLDAFLFSDSVFVRPPFPTALHIHMGRSSVVRSSLGMHYPCSFVPGVLLPAPPSKGASSSLRGSAD